MEQKQALTIFHILGTFSTVSNEYLSYFMQKMAIFNDLEWIVIKRSLCGY